MLTSWADDVAPNTLFALIDRSLASEADDSGFRGVVATWALVSILRMSELREDRCLVLLVGDEGTGREKMCDVLHCIKPAVPPMLEIWTIMPRKPWVSGVCLWIQVTACLESRKVPVALTELWE